MTLDLLKNFWGAQDGKSRIRKCSLLLLTNILFAFILPYDSAGQFDFILSTGEWITHALILMMTSGIIGRWLFPRLITNNTSISFSIALYSALNTIPVFIISIGYTLFLTPYGESFIHEASIYFWWGIESYIFTLLVISLLSIIAVKFELTSPPTNSTEKQTRPGQRFLNRLPPEIGANLVCLEMEDHYVRVHTSRGSSLLHLRMSDAIHELGDFEGIQVHRSWWVANDAIASISKQKRDYKISLKNGMTVPVSRSRVESLKHQNLL